MGTKCKFNKGFQEFSNTPQFIACGNISANASVVNSTTETSLISRDIPGSLLDVTTKQFRVTLAGTLSSDGTDDVTFTLRYGTTDVLAIVTVSLPDEDDKAFMLEYVGRIHTVGATGKVVAAGRFETEATGIANIVKSTAVAGATVDLTADGSINVTAEFDDGSATSDVIVHTGIIEFFN